MARSWCLVLTSCALVACTPGAAPDGAGGGGVGGAGSGSSTHGASGSTSTDAATTGATMASTGTSSATTTSTSTGLTTSFQPCGGYTDDFTMLSPSWIANGPMVNANQQMEISLASDAAASLTRQAMVAAPNDCAITIDLTEIPLLLMPIAIDLSVVSGMNFVRTRFDGLNEVACLTSDGTNATAAPGSTPDGLAIVLHDLEIDYLYRAGGVWKSFATTNRKPFLDGGAKIAFSFGAAASGMSANLAFDNYNLGDVPLDFVGP